MPALALPRCAPGLLPTLTASLVVHTRNPLPASVACLESPPRLAQLPTCETSPGASAHRSSTQRKQAAVHAVRLHAAAALSPIANVHRARSASPSPATRAPLAVFCGALPIALFCARRSREGPFSPALAPETGVPEVRTASVACRRHAGGVHAPYHFAAAAPHTGPGVADRMHREQR